MDEAIRPVTDRLAHLTQVFGDKDPYLGSVGMVTIYYAYDRFLEERGEARLTRQEVEQFESLRAAIKRKEEDNLTFDERLVAEFATYSQGPTSGTYLTERLRILARVLRSIDTADIDDEDGSG